MPFTYFRNGKAVGASSGSDTTIFGDQFADCVLVEGTAYDDLWFYKNGAVHPVPKATKDTDKFDYQAGAWVASEPLVRQRRDQLLAESDWTDLASSSARLGGAKYKAWQDYRQALRDLPQQPGYPNNVVWPQPPQ